MDADMNIWKRTQEDFQRPMREAMARRRKGFIEMQEEYQEQTGNSQY